MKPHVWGLIVLYRSFIKDEREFLTWLKHEGYNEYEISRIYEKLSAQTPYKPVYMHEVV